MLALLVNGSAFAAPPLAAEKFTVEPLPSPGLHWVYVVDEAFYNEIDARVRLFDGDSYRHLGQIDAGLIRLHANLDVVVNHPLDGH